MSNEMMKREMQEAVQAGERALQSLYAARDKLGSARNWGIFDMLGGGFISDFVKHSKMNDAAALMEQAKSDIQRFQRELRDVQVSLDLRMEIGSFLSFADFFLDGLVADYMVQSKITDAREQVDDAINRIEKILADVKKSNECGGVLRCDYLIKGRRFRKSGKSWKYRSRDSFRSVLRKG